MNQETVLGVNLAAGVAYLGVVARPCLPVVDQLLKALPPTNVDDWLRLKQFGEQLAVAARACNAVCIYVALERGT